MTTSKFVILGGGMVAGYAAKEMVERGLKPGQLTIVSADTSIPYERPPLSKGFLAGKETEESIRINAPDFYDGHGIDVRLRSEVAGVDEKSKVLHFRSGDTLGYEKLIVATGARVRTLEIPGRDLKGIYYLRSLEDSKRIREQAQSSKRAVVIGGGFIGMEVTASLAQKGVVTTMVLREDRIWKQFFTPGMSRFFEGYYEAKGVQFARSATPVELSGNGAVQSLRLDGKTLECDMVVAGIGVHPVIEPLAKTGLALENGIVVNEYLESSDPDIYGAGDVANYQDTLFGKRRRVEHWDNAVSQGQHLGRTLLGERTPFVHIPYFFSDVFDLSYELWGDPSHADTIVERGDLSTNSFSVWWLYQEHLVAAFTMNRPDDEREAAPRWIQSKRRLSAETLKGSPSLSDAS